MVRERDCGVERGSNTGGPDRLGSPGNHPHPAWPCQRSLWVRASTRGGAVQRWIPLSMRDSNTAKKGMVREGSMRERGCRG